MLNSPFLSSKHTREVYSSLRCFSEVDFVQSIYVKRINKSHYSVYIFYEQAEKTFWDKLLELRNEIFGLYPNHLFLFQFSHLQDTAGDVFKKDNGIVMIFNRENEHG